MNWLAMFNALEKRVEKLERAILKAPRAKIKTTKKVATRKKAKHGNQD